MVDQYIILCNEMSNEVAVHVRLTAIRATSITSSVATNVRDLADW